MPKTIKNSYNAGELSSYMDGRTDVSKYHNGCSKLVNATVLPHGGVVKRTGSKFIAQAPNKCKHFGFEFSVADTLVLEFSHKKLRFYKSGARVYSTDATLARNIDSVTDVSPPVVNTDAAKVHTLSSGDWVHIDDVAVATALNDKHYVIKVLSTTSYEIYHPIYEGTVDATGATLSDATQDWATNELAGLTVINLDDLGTTDATDVVASNTSTVATMAGTGDTIAFVDGDRYVICEPVAAAGAGTSGGIGRQVYELTTPYTSAEAFEIHTTQSADVMYIAHEDHPPYKLSRAGDADWTLAAVAFDGGPFLTENFDEDKTLKITGSNLTSTSGGPKTVINDTTQAWTVNGLAGYTFYNITNDESKEIASNTATQITLTGATTSNNVDTNEYIVIKNGYYIPAGMQNLTLTATGHTPFLGTANDVGTKWQLTHTRDDNKQDTQDNTTNPPNLPTDLSNAIRVQGDFSFTTKSSGSPVSGRVVLFRKEGNGEWQEHREFRAATAYSATEEEFNVYYAWGRSNSDWSGKIIAENQIWNGVATVTALGTTSDCTVSATTDIYWVGANATNDNETSLWAEGAWGIYRGYPRTVQFFEDRLWWASSTNNPDTLWGSKSSDYEDMRFTNLGLDDDAIVAPIQDNEVSQIQWMQSRQVMAVGSANKEYRYGHPDPDQAVTPSKMKSTPQTSFGSDSIHPVILNNAIFFLQRQGRKLRAMQFDVITENFKSDDATLLANTLLESTPVCMATQRVPESIVWIVRTDGVLLSFTYEPEEEVSGWARHMTQNSTSVEQPTGYYESVAVVHGDKEDDVWLSVKRTVDRGYANNTTNTYRYTEVYQPRLFTQVGDAVMLDSAKVVTSDFDSQNIVYAADTVRYGGGNYGSSTYGRS